MKLVTKTAVCGLAAALVVGTVAVTEAEARRGRVVAGVAAGLIIGGIVAGAAAANARERTYYRSGPDCGYFKRQAVWNEENGRPRRAVYWWDRYEACTGG